MKKIKELDNELYHISVLCRNGTMIPHTLDDIFIVSSAKKDTAVNLMLYPYRTTTDDPDSLGSYWISIRDHYKVQTSEELDNFVHDLYLAQDIITELIEDLHVWL